MKMVKIEQPKEINYSKWFQKDFLQAVQLKFVQTSLMLFDFKLQVLQSNYFMDLVAVIRKENHHYSVQISLFLLNLMAK